MKCNNVAYCNLTNIQLFKGISASNFYSLGTFCYSVKYSVLTSEECMILKHFGNQFSGVPRIVNECALSIPK